MKNLVWALCLSLSAGCAALFQKSEPLAVQYFAPEERSDRFESQAPYQGPPLRLGRVAASAHLEQRMLHRNGQSLSYQDAARWSENPARFLERGLAHALFEERSIPQAISGRAFTLEADLVAFEQVQVGGPKARVSVTWTLHDERTSHIYETVTVERELSRDSPSPVALSSALSRALDECIERIATRAQNALSAATP